VDNYQQKAGKIEKEGIIKDSNYSKQKRT
jgi:hypothetical protein